MSEKPVVVVSGLRSAIGRSLMEESGDAYRLVGLGRRTAPVGAEGADWIGLDFRRPVDLWQGELERELDRLEVKALAGLVHLAGVIYSDRLERTTINEWEDTLAVNLTAAFVLLQRLKPKLAEGSSVILVSSVDAWHQARLGPAAAYGASKAGLIGLARHAAAEWGELGIRVNVIAPGALEGGMGPQSEDGRGALTGQIALGRLGRPREVASAIRFLLSEQSSYITGAVIPVDGGLNVGY